MADQRTSTGFDQLVLRAVFIPTGQAAPPDLLDMIGDPVRIPATLAADAASGADGAIGGAISGPPQD